ncbi:MAG: phage tail tape measure protein, partial [Paenibacillus sp.]|nr:phage tail tape measure protein [Paenibacillus sp.]
INIDNSKLLPAFKVIDEGIKKNAEAFRSLNQELTISAKNYSEIARAADKVALSADERRQKILAESNALVAQRTAQAELLTARKNALDTTNQVIDAKLQAQQAIVKKREDAIEHQEKEHQQRMATLQQKTVAASGQENIMQARLDKEFMIQKGHHQRMIQQEERRNQQMVYAAEKHAVQMNKLMQPNESVLGRSMQYMASGTLYYSAIQGAREAIQVIKDFKDLGECKARYGFWCWI